MARINVNPTRMELTRLKGRLKTATRGHKLLKDKRDELMKQFLDCVRKNKELREKVEQMLASVNTSFTIASAVMSPEGMQEALMCPKQAVSVEVSTKNIMSVDTPVFDFKMENEGNEIYAYGYGFTSGELDNAVSHLNGVLPFMLELAQMEKSAQLLADEIEKTRRRVNALEHVMIPQLTETIKYIKMKLDENERGATTRLMKVKDMMLSEARAQQAALDA